MRKVALGLFGVVACALGPIALSAIDSLSLTGCGPLANDPSEDAAAGGNGNNDSGSSSQGGEDSGSQAATDSGGSSSHDGGASGSKDGESTSTDSGSGGGDDAGGGEDAPASGNDAAQSECTPVTTWVEGAGIDNSTWSATAIANPNDVTDVVTHAFDNMMATRWSTGAAQTAAAGQYFTLNLGSMQSFDQVALFYPASGDAGVTDYPTEYTIGVSNSADGPFTQVASGAGASPTVSCFPTQTAQFIQISQTGTSAAGSWLSIYEMQVFAN